MFDPEGVPRRTVFEGKDQSRGRHGCFDTEGEGFVVSEIVSVGRAEADRVAGAEGT